jgi:hypothetical protein
MVALGYALLALGFIVGLYGEIRFLVVAYNRNLWWFFWLPVRATRSVDFPFPESEGHHQAIRSVVARTLGGWLGLLDVGHCLA